MLNKPKTDKKGLRRFSKGFRLPFRDGSPLSSTHSGRKHVARRPWGGSGAIKGLNFEPVFSPDDRPPPLCDATLEIDTRAFALFCQSVCVPACLPVLSVCSSGLEFRSHHEISSLQNSASSIEAVSDLFCQAYNGPIIRAMEDDGLSASG